MTDDAKTEALRRCVEALERHGSHNAGCVYDGDEMTCDCGMLDAIREASAALAEPSRTYGDGVRDERARVVAHLQECAVAYAELECDDESEAISLLAEDIDCGVHEEP